MPAVTLQHSGNPCRRPLRFLEIAADICRKVCQWQFCAAFIEIPHKNPAIRLLPQCLPLVGIMAEAALLGRNIRCISIAFHYIARTAGTCAASSYLVTTVVGIQFFLRHRYTMGIFRRNFPF